MSSTRRKRRIKSPSRIPGVQVGSEVVSGLDGLSCDLIAGKAIARIEELARTIFNNLAEFKASSERLHAEHFEAANALRREASDMCRSFDVRVSKHDVDIASIQKTRGKVEALLQEIAQGAARNRGIAVGLGMAGGAVVSILTMLTRILK